MDTICRDMPRFGVTGFVPTIVTSAPDVYAPALANLGRRARPGEAAVLGVHIEGPYISPLHKGTHDPAQLRLPDIREAAAWLEAGSIAWLTLAPELPGAIPLIEFLAGNGVRVSMGHTDATWDQASAAADAGATMATHLFNAMRPFRHRDPGVVGFALGGPLRTGFIADGNHLAFDTIRVIARAKAPDRADPGDGRAWPAWECRPAATGWQAASTSPTVRAAGSPMEPFPARCCRSIEPFETS